MEFEQKKGLVFRDSGFRLASALPVQRKCLQIFPSLLKMLVSLATVFQHFVSDLAHHENTVISKNTGVGQWFQALRSFGLGPSVGKLTLGCCCRSTNSLFLTLVSLGLLWLTASLLTSSKCKNRAFPTCEDCCDLLQNNLCKGVEELGRTGEVTVSWAGHENKWHKRL